MTVGLDAIGIVAADLAESCRFYRTLGLDVPGPRDEEQRLEATLASGVRPMRDTVELVGQPDPDRSEPRGRRSTLAFGCGDAAGVDAAHRRLVAAGFRSKREPWEAFWGQRYAQVFDPDGNAVDLFAPL